MVAQFELFHHVVHHRDKQPLVTLAEQAPLPVVDGLPQLVFYVVGRDVAHVRADGLVVAVVVGIAVGLHLTQRDLAEGRCRECQRDRDRLGIGIGRAGVGRDVLVVDVDVALDVPVVGGRCLFVTRVLVGFVYREAVVYNFLVAMYEVARRLDVVLLRLVVLIAAVGAGRQVVGRQRHLVPHGLAVRVALTVPLLQPVLVLGIDVAATHAYLYVDEVELHHAGDVAPHGVGVLLGQLADKV